MSCIKYTLIFVICYFGLYLYLCSDCNTKINEPEITLPVKQQINTLKTPWVRSADSNYAEANLENITYSIVIIGYMENSRNNPNYKIYPPCFDLSNKAIEIFDIFNKHNIVIKYKKLFEAMSILLCEENYQNKNVSMHSQLQERLNDLEILGFKRNNSLYANKVNKILNITDSNKIQQYVWELLLRVTTIIENEIINLETNNDLSKDNIIIVKNLINQFYNNHYKSH
jgi:hypothetical protein